MPDQTEVAHEWLAELEAFVARHGRLPARKSVGEPKALYQWMRRVSQGQEVPAQVRAGVAKLVAQFGRPAPEQSARQRLAELEAFVEVHGRLPGTATGTKSLRGWVYSVRSGLSGQVPDDVRDRVAELVRVHRDADSAERARRRMAELEDFVAERGVFPPVKDEDPRVRALYVWFSAPGTLPDDVQARFTALVRWVTQSRPAKRVTRATPPGPEVLDALEEFVVKTGRFPEVRSESRLTSWVTMFRAGDGIPAEMLGRFAVLESWRWDIAAQWVTRLEKFVAVSGRLPAWTNGAPGMEQEEQLFRWLRRYRRGRQLRAEMPDSLRERVDHAIGTVR